MTNKFKSDSNQEICYHVHPKSPFKPDPLRSLSTTSSHSGAGFESLLGTGVARAELFYLWQNHGLGNLSFIRLTHIKFCPYL